MTRSKVLLAWSALLLGLSACDKTTDSAGGKSKPAELTVNLSSTELSAGGSPVDVSVAATSDTGIASIAPTFKSSSGALVTGSFLPQFTTMPKVGDKSFASSGWKLSALSTAAAGSYTMTLTLTDKSGAITTKEVAFVVKSGSSSPGAPVITGFGLDNTSPEAGGSFSSKGSVSFETSSADVSYSVTGPSATSIMLPASFTVSSSPASLSKLLVISSSASAGIYTVTVRVTDRNGKSATSEATFQVTSTVVGEPLRSIGSLPVGAQGSAQGSFLELSGSKAGVAWTSGTNIPYSTIDVIFGAAGTTPTFFSPDYAASSGAFTLSTWTTKNTSALVDMGTTMPASSAPVAVALAASGSSSVTVVPGHYYGVGTESGDIVVLYVFQVTGSGRSSQAEVEVYLVDGGTVVIPETTDWPKLDLGAQNAAQPSALDVDGMMAYTSGAKTASEIAEIDLLLYYQGAGLRFLSPANAKVNSLSLVNGWGQTNETYIYDNGTTPVTSLSQAVGILSGETTSNSIEVVSGHYYIVEQADGLLCAVRVVSVTGTGASSVVRVGLKVLGNSPFGGD